MTQRVRVLIWWSIVIKRSNIRLPAAQYTGRSFVGNIKTPVDTLVPRTGPQYSVTEHDNITNKLVSNCDIYGMTVFIVEQGMSTDRGSAYIHKHIHTYIHTYIHKHIHTYTHIIT